MVRDTGKGFGPDGLAHVFNAFCTTKPEGIEMGLTISRSIVQQHGGRLWAMQNEPHGAAFHLSVQVGVPATSKHVQETSNWRALKLHRDLRRPTSEAELPGSGVAGRNCNTLSEWAGNVK